jgi:hypothetical protein
MIDFETALGIALGNGNFLRFSNTIHIPVRSVLIN